MTRNERLRLDGRELAVDQIGWDCNTEPIRVDDKVRVVAVPPDRDGRTEYDFCKVGAEGVVNGFGPWGKIPLIVEVAFGGRWTQRCALCADYQLQKI